MKSVLVLLFFSSTIFSSTKLADVNGKIISVEEFNEKFQLNLNTYQTNPITKEGVLDDIISRELAIQMAKKEGFESKPEVQERIGTVLFTAYIESKLRDKFNAVKIGDAEVKSFNDQNPTIRSSHILVKCHPVADEKTQKACKDKIDTIYGAVKADPKKFEQLAKKQSDAPEAVVGGDLNFRRKDELDPNFYANLKNLKKDQISSPVRSQFGWHIIKRTDTLAFPKVEKGKIRAMIFDERRKQIFDQFFKDLRKNNKVSVDYSLLKNK